MRLIDQRLGEISDPQIGSLISELEHACKVARDPAYTLYNYLIQCLHPWGDTRFSIDRNLIIPGGLLSRKIGKLAGTPVYQICDEIGHIHGQTAEVVEGTALYVFLNRYLPDFRKKPRKRPHDPRPWL